MRRKQITLSETEVLDNARQIQKFKTQSKAYYDKKQANRMGGLNGKLIEKNFKKSSENFFRKFSKIFQKIFLPKFCKICFQKISFKNLFRKNIFIDQIDS